MQIGQEFFLIIFYLLQTVLLKIAVIARKK